jgi:hypothetical protein
MNIDDKVSGIVTRFYLGVTVTNQNLLCEEIKSRINSGNSLYYSVHNFIILSPKNLKIRIDSTIKVCVVKYSSRP